MTMFPPNITVKSNVFKNLEIKYLNYLFRKTSKQSYNLTLLLKSHNSLVLWIYVHIKSLVSYDLLK